MMLLGPSSTWSGTFSDQDGRAGNRLFSKHVNQAQIASRSERTTVRKQERREQRDGISFFHLIGEWTGGRKEEAGNRRGHTQVELQTQTVAKGTSWAFFRGVCQILKDSWIS